MPPLTREQLEYVLRTAFDVTEAAHWQDGFRLGITWAGRSLVDEQTDVILARLNRPADRAPDG
jgi:hypothetical protein